MVPTRACRRRRCRLCFCLSGADPALLPCLHCREEEDHEEELAHREDLASAGSTDMTAVLRGETRLTQASPADTASVRAGVL